MREDHLKFSSELARYSNEVTTTYKEAPRSDAENRYVPDSVNVADSSASASLLRLFRQGSH